MTALLQTPQDVLYPETDGLPLSDNTKQFRLIMTTQGGLDALFQHEQVFVAGNLLWYPVEKEPVSTKPAESKAPDVMVIFGQDKSDRTSYLQWQEKNLGPQVVFEFVSTSNTREEVEGEKLKFYQKHGVEEYYIHDPDEGTLKGWMREGTWFQPVDMNGWISPLLGIRFELIGKEMQLYYPNGEPFETYPEIMERWKQERQLRKQQQQRAIQAETQLRQEQQLREQAESQLEQKNSQLEQERQQRRQLAEQLSNLDPEQLKALGIDPEMLA